MRGIQVDGPAIVARRAKQALSQNALSSLARVDVKTVRSAEQGKRLDADTIARLAAALDCDVSELVLSDVPSRQRDTWRQVVVDWQRLFDEHDGEGMAALYHEEAVLVLPGEPNVPFGGTFRGRAEIRQVNEKVWSLLPQEPIRGDEVTLLVSDAGVTLMGAKGIYLPDGRLVRFPCLQLFIFQDDLILEHHVQFDTLDYMKQVAGES